MEKVGEVEEFSSELVDILHFGKKYIYTQREVYEKKEDVLQKIWEWDDAMSSILETDYFIAAISK